MTVDGYAKHLDRALNGFNVKGKWTINEDEQLPIFPQIFAARRHCYA